MRLLPLGTNGFIPSQGRQTMSLLVEEGGALVLVDAGTGVARLLEPEAQRLLAGVERLDVVLTHYHLDHVIGLSYLPGIARDRRIRIFAPAPPLTAAGPEGLDRLIGPPLFPVPFARWPMPVEIVPYGGPALTVDRFEISVRAQDHPGGSAGLRFGDAFAYVTDTVADPATAAFARGVALLLHEVWATDAEAEQEDAGRTGHSAAGAVADLARAAGVAALAPVHHHPRRDAAALDAIAAALRARSGLPVVLPAEGRILPLPA